MIYRFTISLALLAIALPSFSAPAPPVSALARMPVKEITVFKDGHAFVLHEGKLPTDDRGNVQMDYLPTPVIGTFWPYSADKNVKLSAVIASKRRVSVERTALTARELLEANPGLNVDLTDTYNVTHKGTIVGVPTRSADELEATSPPNTDESLPVKGNVLLMKEGEGTLVEPLDSIRTLTMIGAYKTKLASEEFRNLLTLKLNWQGAPGKTADVGLMYLQKGVRWIPQYKVDLDGKGNVTIRLQATLINELTDLDDVTANLVIGVPSFSFKDTIDPMALQQSIAQLSQYFQTDSRMNYGFSNAIMTQQARAGDFAGGMAGAPPGGARPPDLGPEIGGQEKSEDLFVYTVKHITLRKGERMVVPIGEYTLKYKDVYTLDVPFGPPAEMRSNINMNDEQQVQLARLFNAPKVQHVVRISNKTDQPFTTAPALIMSGNRVIGQGMMTYTPVNGTAELTLTTAVDVTVKKNEKEVKRTPNAVVWQGTQFTRVDMTGTLTLTNYKNAPIELEVSRFVLGVTDTVDHNGKAEMLNPLEDESLPATIYRPYWWNWYSWPGWWGHFNGIGRFSWKTTLGAGKSVDFGYTWTYYVQ